MNIIVNLYGGLDKHASRLERKGNRITIKKGSTIQNLLQKYNIPETEASIFLVNGVHRQPDYEMQESDEISIFPMLGGG